MIPEILGVLRHALTVIAGALVAHGIIEGSMVEPIVGAIVTLVTIGWSIWAKQRSSPEAVKVATNVVAQGSASAPLEPISKED